MFLRILAFELRSSLKRFSTWLYFALFFGLSFLIVNLFGGAFESFSLNSQEQLNSPSWVAGIVGQFSILGLLVTAGIFGQAAYRDYEVGIHPLLFTAPITKRAYLGGRFTGALLVNLLVVSGLSLGLLVASWMPYLDAERFGPFRIEAYAQPYLLFLLPNLALTGAIFFALAALTRQMLANYVGSMALMVGYLSAQQFLADIEHRTLGAMLDPFGFTAVSEATQYWTAAEKNALLLPLDATLVGNRVLWLAVGCAIFASAYLRFRFSHQVAERKTAGEEAAEATERPASIVIPAVRRGYGAREQLVQYLSTTRREFLGIVTNVYFRAIVGVGLVFLTVNAYHIGKLYGTSTYPVTYSVLDALGASFWLLVMVIVTFQAGDLVWRDRERRISGLVDTLPASTWIAFASKFTALLGMIVVLMGVATLFGIASQAARGYYHFEIGLYLQRFFVFGLLEMTLWIAFALAIHAVVNQKYVGYFLAIGYFIGVPFLGYFDLHHPLYTLGSGDVAMYSDMNVWGHSLPAFFLHKLYWGAFTLLLAVLSNLLWVRGTEAGWKQRLCVLRGRFHAPVGRFAAAGGLLFAGTGGFIFYNTNVLHEWHTSTDERGRTAEYERKYKRFEDAAQPRIVGVDAAVDIFPEERVLHVHGAYRLVNRTSAAIDSVHVRYWEVLGVDEIAFDRESHRVNDDRKLGYLIFELAEPLAPGDSMQMRFRFSHLPRGFSNANHSPVRRNGTFLNNMEVMPSIGYDPRHELSSDGDRKKEGLQPKPRMAAVTDTAAWNNHEISTDSDWIDFAITVSTASDQIAVAPGYLQREWNENGRRYFRYEMDAPMLNFYSVLSARYQVKKDLWTSPEGEEVAIEIFYHPGHEYNLERMIRSVKRSLDYYSEQFGPYQHRQVRILEFPRYGSFAQSFANTIPYSEGVGFIARVDDEEEDVDYPFFITAHEVAHQWWGHQVTGAGVQGSSLISETLSEYSALMTMKKEYGAQRMRKFLEYELDGYLSGRTFEAKKEMPLLRVEGQRYIHYSKGSVAMYALQDYIGEDRVNAALRSFLQAHRFQGPPYPTSLDLYRHLEAVTPDSMRMVLSDLFERITLYENRVVEATTSKRPDGRYAVELKIAAKKVYADSLGVESEAKMADLVDIGVFAEPRKGGDKTSVPLYLRKHRIRSGEQTIELVVGREPARAGIDPYHKLIDRQLNDNVAPVTKRGKAARTE